MKRNAPIMTKFLKKSLSVAIEKGNDLRFDKTNPQQLYAICVYGRLLNMISEFLDLISRNRFASAPILLRAIIEIFVDFRNNLEDPNYFKNMIASHEHNKRILLTYAIRYKKNDFFQYFHAHMEDIKAEKIAVKKRLIKLETDGYLPLSVNQRFIRANLRDEYNSIYQQLTYDVHNSIGVLESQCLEQSDGSYRAAWFPAYDPEDYWHYLDFLSGFLIESTTNLHERFGNKDDTIIGNLGKELLSIRKKHPGNAENVG